MKSLDPRLQLVANMVTPCKRLVDVGTDHAYLPVYLVKENIVELAIASDLRSGPLSHAQATVSAAGLNDKIQLRLSDGLDKIQPHEVECVVMAGMGGILITQLIERAQWLRDESKHLILQPMTDAPLVREFLYQNGFDILCERAAVDHKHCYTVMKVTYVNRPKELTPLQKIVGALDRPLGSSERIFLQKERQRLHKQIVGLQAANLLDDINELSRLYDELSKLLGES